jgi:hypothetical protein
MKRKWILKNIKTNDVLQLDTDPRGWREMGVKRYRSEQYNGIFKEPTVKQLTFMPNGAGAEWIETVLATDDINAEIAILCYRQPTEADTYSLFMEGVLSIASLSRDENFLTFTIEQSSLYQKLLAREDISIDLESTTSVGGTTISAVGSEAIDMPGQEIRMISSWRILQGTTQTKAASYTIAGNYSSLFFFDGVEERSDLKDTNPMVALSFHEDDGVGTGNITQLIRDNFIVPLLDSMQSGIDYPITINYDIDLNGTITDTESTSGGLRDIVSYRLVLYYGNPNSTLNTVTLYTSASSSANVATFNFNIAATGSISLSPADHVYLAWVYEHDVITTPTIICEFNYDESTVSFVADTNYKASTTKAFLIHEAFNQVSDAIADRDGSFQSAFYGREDSAKVSYDADGEGSLLAITNGDNIREKVGKSVFCSFKELFNSANALHNLGMDIFQNTIRVEPLSFFYSNSRICTLEYVKEFRSQLSTQHYINHITTGYTAWETEFANGLDEPNTRHEYSTAIQALNNKLELLSQYIGSSYAIEVTRRKGVNLFPKEDFKYDNNNFWLALKRDGLTDFAVELLADAFVSASDMIAKDTALNLRLTPGRMLLAHLNKITAGMQIIGGDIKFVKGEGNTEFLSRKIAVGHQEDYNNVFFAENSDIVWNDSNAANIAPLWLPIVYEFEFPLTQALRDAIDINPYGYIEFFRYADQRHKAYILSMEENLENGLTKFKLLKKYGN